MLQPLGDIGQLKNYLDYLYHPERDPSGLSEPDRTHSHITNMEDKVESVLEFLSCWSVRHVAHHQVVWDVIQLG